MAIGVPDSLRDRALELEQVDLSQPGLDAGREHAPRAPDTPLLPQAGNARRQSILCGREFG